MDHAIGILAASMTVVIRVGLRHIVGFGGFLAQYDGVFRLLIVLNVLGRRALRALLSLIHLRSLLTTANAVDRHDVLLTAFLSDQRKKALAGFPKP
jgi:hypothetical protein